MVGNEIFSDEELLAGMEVNAHNWLSFYRRDDRYSRELLEGDLEKLRSYYMDRGYADFEITSTQVALAPEKDDLFITVNVFEGGTWKMGAVKLAGRFVVPEEMLRQYLVIRPGDKYSQRLIAPPKKALRDRLNEAGFGFAEVAAVPSRESGRPARSRSRSRSSRMRAPMCGASTSAACRSTHDEVLRREMRQLEGAVLSNAALTRSEERLQRLPYIEKVETETTARRRASPDLVDIDVTVEEGPSSTVGGGIGYSERQSFMLSGNSSTAICSAPATGSHSSSTVASTARCSAWRTPIRTSPADGVSRSFKPRTSSATGSPRRSRSSPPDLQRRLRHRVSDRRRAVLQPRV